MDFALLMLIVLCATGIIWLLDRLFGLPVRRARAEQVTQAGGSPEAVQAALKEPVYVEYARAFFPVILAVFLLRSFLVEPFRIPSGSMLPTLLVGDFILVNKFGYGLRLPVINDKIVGIGTPKRGDVIVFRFPEDPSINYIKRVVGLPGDRVMYQDKRLYINGELVKDADSRPYKNGQPGDCAFMATRLLEQLDGVSHDILLTDRIDLRTLTFVVPAHHYFVMGDNRDCSNDSRFWGYVPDANLVGRAFLVWFNVDTTRNYAYFWNRIDWHRIGTIVH
jgi:signal peptidase I